MHLGRARSIRLHFVVVPVMAIMGSAFAQTATVRQAQKISNTAGGFDGRLVQDDHFGLAVAGLDDLNGDGTPDIAVGAPHAPFTDETGAIWILFMNPDGTVDASQRIDETNGGFGGTLAPNADFGRSLAALGDIDGNGACDLAVGARGEVWILFLQTDGTVLMEQVINEQTGGFRPKTVTGFGEAVAPLGDLNQDGFVDLAVSETVPRRIWLFMLSGLGTVLSHDFIDADLIPELADSCRPGLSLGLRSPLDGSGPAVLLAGDPGCNATGVIDGDVWQITIAPFVSSVSVDHLTASESLQHVDHPDRSSDLFGRAVAAIDDIDSDGLGDLLIGADQQLDGTGAVWVVDGTLRCQQPIMNGAGGLDDEIQPSSRFGRAVAPAGDIDGDGVGDLVVGAYRDNDGTGNRTGAVWILFMNEPEPGFVSRWTCADGNLLDDCWDRCHPPRPQETLVFDAPGARSIDNTTAFVARRLLLERGQTTMRLPGPLILLSPFSVEPDIAIGAGGTAAGLNLDEGILLGGHVHVGSTAGSIGIVAIDGAGTKLEAQSLLYVGRAGIGLLDVTSGGRVVGEQVVLASASASYSSVLVEGPGSMLDAQGQLTVAQSGFVDLAVTDGASIESGAVILAHEGQALADARVSGQASWSIDGALDVGLNGSGSLIIETGATVTCTSFATIGTFGSMPPFDDSLGNGIILVDGDGAHLDVGGALFVGFFGDGTLILSRGGAVTAGGGVDIGQGGFAEGIGAVVIRIGSADHYAATPAVSGGGSGFGVEFVDGFVPSLGDSFLLGGSPGALPPLPDGLAWFVQRGTITVLGEPDADGNGLIDVEDLIALLVSWGACRDCPADFDGDGSVSVDDLVFLLMNWS